MRNGFILRMIGSTRHYFQSYIKNNLSFVEDKRFAWFTSDSSVADQMVKDLEHYEVMVVRESFSHE